MNESINQAISLASSVINVFLIQF